MKQLYNFFYDVINKSLKKRASSLLILLIVSSIIDIFSIGIIVPFFQFVFNSNPQNTLIYKFLKYTRFDFFLTISRMYFLLILVLFFFVKNIFLAFVNYLQNQFVFLLQEDISNHLFSNYLHNTYEFHKNNSTSLLIRNMTNEVNSVSNAVLNVFNLISESLILIFVLIFLFIYQFYITFIIVITLGVPILLLNAIVKNKINQIGSQRQLYDGNKLKVIQQGLIGIKDIKIFSIQKFFLKNFYFYNKKSKVTAIEQNFLPQVPRFILDFLMIFSLVTVTFYLVNNNYTNEQILIIGGVFAASSFRILPSINRILTSLSTIKFSLPSFRVISNHILNNFKDHADSKSLNEIDLIEIKNLSYSYNEEGSRKIILENINIDFKIGDKIGIIGKSGSGKSTLIDILTGLLKPDSINSFVNGENITFYENPTWKNKISYVPQKIFLLDDSLKNNILFGINENVNDNEFLKKIIDITNLTQFSSDINRNIGEFGTKISGGQMQRIGIARALYRKTDILILDEGTSALDTENELEILNSILDLNFIKIIIFITHKPSNLRYCNKVYKIQDGQITLQ
jgi:ABC-type multidrug transport system fused ATPase/permease subunit